jgi:hypothetical protein
MLRVVATEVLGAGVFYLEAGTGVLRFPSGTFKTHQDRLRTT